MLKSLFFLSFYSLLRNKESGARRSTDGDAIKNQWGVNFKDERGHGHRKKKKK
jgi:hypothetical protein